MPARLSKTLPTRRPNTWDTKRLLAFHKAHFGDARMDYPAGDGGAGDGGQGGEGGAGDGGTGAGSGDGGGQGSNEPEFPPNTPVAEMTDKQAAAYWKHQSRKHEGTAKSRADYDALKAKADELDTLKQANQSEQEKALEEARKTAKAEGEAAAATALQPKLVRAEMKSAFAGRIDPARLDALLDPLDMSKFLTDSGDVDTDKVLAFVENAAPKDDGKGGGGSGFPNLGQGRRQGAGQPSVASGAELFASRHKKSSQSA